MLLNSNLQSHYDVIENYSMELAEQFVDYFRKCQGGIISVLGIQYSGVVGNYICRRINNKGYISHNGHPIDVEVHKKNDNPCMFIAVSRSGEYQHVLHILEDAISYGYYTIGITARSDSKIATMCQLPIIVSPGSEDFAGRDIDLFTGRAITAFELLFYRV